MAHESSMTFSNKKGNFGGGSAPANRQGTMSSYRPPQKRASSRSSPSQSGNSSYLSGAANAANQQRLSTYDAGQSRFGGGSLQGWSVTTPNYGGGMGAQGIKALMRQQKKEAEERNKRFEAIMKRQRELREKMMNSARGAIEGAGTARRQDIRETGVRRGAQGAQNLISKGLGNTTITSAVQRGVAADTSRNMTYQRSQEAGQMSGLYAQEAGMLLGEGQFQLGGERGMGGGLEDYIAMLASLGGGLS